MERFQQRLDVAHKAVAMFTEILAMPVTTVVRDGAIKRFELAVEAIWKLTQHYLREKEGVDLNSPKSVMRYCLQVDLLDAAQTQLALQMIDDRNLSVHTYNEELAEQIFQRLPQYRDLLAHLLQRIEVKA